MDDMVSTIKGPSGEDVLQIFDRVLQSATRASRQYGLSTNLDDGKTEVVISFVGPKEESAYVVLRDLAPPPDVCRGERVATLTSGLRIVAVYKHGRGQCVRW